MDGRNARPRREDEAKAMTRRVMICVPEVCLDDPRWGEAVDYDQRIGRLVSDSGNTVSIDGISITFPATWIKPINEKQNA